MKAIIKETGQAVEVVSRFMPKKRNAPNRAWVCVLSDGRIIDEDAIEYVAQSHPAPDANTEAELEEAAFTYENDLWESGFKDCGYSPQEVNDAFKAGAEWGMNQMPLPEDTTIFQKGVAEGKRLMMEGAVGGRYMKAYSKVYVESWPLDIDPDSVKAGDEVRLIVIPKED